MALDGKTVAGYARLAGFYGNALVTAVAIAHAESQFDSGAHNTNAKTGDDSYGLWQINMIGSLGPQRRKLFGITTDSQLLDPMVNANAAMKIYKGRGYAFTDWTTFKNGSHQKYMADAKTAVASLPNSGKQIGTNWKDPFWVNLEKNHAATPGTDPAVSNTDTPFKLPSIPNPLDGISAAITGFAEQIKLIGLNFGAIIIVVVLFILGTVILLKANGVKTPKVVPGL